MKIHTCEAHQVSIPGHNLNSYGKGKNDVERMNPSTRARLKSPQYAGGW